MKNTPVPLMGIKEALAFERAYPHRGDCKCQACETDRINLALYTQTQPEVFEDDLEYARR